MSGATIRAHRGLKGVGMVSHPTRIGACPRWFGRAVGVLALSLAGLFLLACEDGDVGDSSAGSELAARWIRAGEELTTSVEVYDRERSEEHTSELQSLMRIA